MLAQDISAQVIEARLCGRDVALRFDHNAMRMTELYWQHTARTPVGYMAIAEQALAGTYVGLGAVCYGAAAAQALFERKHPLEMDRFDALCTYEEMRGAHAAIGEAILASFPRAQGDAKKKEARQATTPGRRCAAQPCTPESATRNSGR